MLFLVHTGLFLEWFFDRKLCCVQVMDMLGPSLWDVWNNNSHM